MKLREYTNEDSILVADIIRASFEQYRSAYDNYERLLSRITNIDGFTQRGELIVAEANDRLVGAVTYVAPNHTSTDYFPADWAFMLMLVVTPSARGQGVGQSLLKECLARAAHDNAEYFALHTTKLMEVAVAMYQKQGFQYHSQGPKIHGVQYVSYVKNMNQGSTTEPPHFR